MYTCANMGRNKRSWRFRLLALLFGGGLSLLAAEAALRIYNPIDLKLRGKQIVLPVKKSFVYHNDGNASKLDATITISANSLGFRGPEPPSDFANWVTLVTVGGSTTECRFLSDDRTWPAQLARLLEARLEKTWINNAGLDGHSTFGHRLLVDQLLYELAPDYVLFLVGINDVGRDDLNKFDATAKPEKQRLHDRIVAASELLSTLQVLYRSYRAFDLGVGHQWELDLRTEPTMTIDPAASAALLADHGSKYVPRFRQRLHALVTTARAAGIEPVLITQPTLFGQTKDPTTGAEIGPQIHANRPAAEHWQILEIYNDATRALGVSENILVIDLARALPKDSALFYDWTHYTNAGAERVAAIIAGDLIPFLIARGNTERRAN